MLEAIGICTLIYLALRVVSAMRPLDDTDDRVNGIRSGIDLRIDRGTGLHYIMTADGLRPRLDANGRQVGLKSDEAISALT